MATVMFSDGAVPLFGCSIELSSFIATMLSSDGAVSLFGYSIELSSCWRQYYFQLVPHRSSTGVCREVLVSSDCVIFRSCRIARRLWNSQ